MGGICCSFYTNDNDESNVPLLLTQHERDAITALLKYLENKSAIDFFSDGPLRALGTLVYSENVELQRSAALAFAEITEKDIREVSRDVLELIMVMLQSNDIEVQRAACGALGNLAVNAENKLLIIKMDGLEPLIKLMMSSNIEVQCNAVGCITNLATQDENKSKIAKSGALIPLIKLTKSKDIRVQRNATGALLNMTHSNENRNELVNAGAISIFVQLLTNDDVDVQYYSTTALSNIAVDESNRKNMSETEPELVSKLIALMDSFSPKVQCQTTLALRNLASDSNYQIEIVKLNGLSHLLKLLTSDHEPLVLAAAACIRNISIHPMNESLLIEAGFLKPLVKLLDHSTLEEIQCHSVSTLRNIAASNEQNRMALLEANAVEKCKELVLIAPLSVQQEISACFAILALADDLKAKLNDIEIIDVLLFLTFSENSEVCGNSAAALANLCSKVPKEYIKNILNHWKEPNEGINGFLIRFLSSYSTTYKHIALWTIIQILELNDKEINTLIKQNDFIFNEIKKINQNDFQIIDLYDNEINIDHLESSKSELYNLSVKFFKFFD